MLIDVQLLLQLLISGLVRGSEYALLAVSFGIIYSTTQLFHMAHALVYTLTAYVAILVSSWLGFPLWLAIPLAIAAATLLGMAVEVGIYRPMRGSHGTVLTLFLSSLGLAIAGQNLVQIVFGPENQSLRRIQIFTFVLGQVTFTTLDILTVLITWSCVGLLLLYLRRTRYGRAIVAIRSNPQMAKAVGIPVDRIFLLVFAIGSLLVSVASLLFTISNVAFPTMGLEPILISIIAVFLGGTQSVPGAAIGGMVLGVVTSLSAYWLSGDFAPVIVFGVLFLILVFRPHGLLGQATARAEG